MPNQTGTVSSAQAHVVISDAFARFKETVNPDDAVLFDNTTVQNVLDAMVTIQQDLRRRRENRNLRKLHPFLEGLRNYGKVLDSLSNGLSPYLPWVWAPIKLALQITSDHLNAFDKLIEAYSRIWDTLPRVEKIGEAFKDNATILTKLALYYADILDFHRRAYKFIRRRSWKFFFMTTWAQFDVRFDAILGSMAYHSDLIAQEATAIDILEAKRWREKLMADSEQKEKYRSEKQRLSVISWLGAKPISQEDECERLLRDYLPGSCDWVDDVFKDWFENNEQHAVVWLNGKPGAGKSVLCASLLRRMEERGLPTIFYFCVYHADDTISEILKSVIIQLVAKNSDLAAIVYTDYVSKCATPSLKTLRAIAIGSSDRPGIISGIPSCRVVIDGLDECNDGDQGPIIDALGQLVAVEYVSVNSAIRGFVAYRLENLNEDHPALQLDSGIKEELSQIMVDKSDGMFLWARLVLDSISDIDSKAELHEAITTMPKQLPELYDVITKRLYSQIACNTAKISKIFAWLVFAKRPLKKNEILHGVAITPETPHLDPWNRLRDTAIDKCRPLVEELSDGSISLVHSTVQEYLMTDCAIDDFRPSTWRETIAFACIRVLTDGLSLLDPQRALSDQLHQIVAGHYALLPYSIDFWVEHLLDCVTDRPLGSNSVIANALENLESTHEHLAHELRGSTGKTMTPQQNEQRLQTIAHLPESSLCTSILAFRKDHKVESAENGAAFATLARRYDPTLLSELSIKYDQLVKQLLSGTEIPSILSREQLELFRRQHLPSSFRCRFSPCRNTSLGFASESARSAHEQLHVNRLFCDKVGCIGTRTGFKSQQHLNRHTKIYHDKGSILVPARIRASLSICPEQGEQKAERIARNYSTADHGTTNVEPEVSKKHDKTNSVLRDPASHTIEVQRLLKLAFRKVTCVCLSADGQLLAIAHQYNTDIYDMSTSKKKWVLTETSYSCPQAIAFSPNSEYLASHSDAGILAVWQINTGAIAYQVEAHGQSIVSVIEFSPDGKKIAVADKMGVVQIWNFAESTSSPYLYLFLHKLESMSVWEICSLSFSPDSLRVAAGDKNGGVHVCEMKINTSLLSMPTSESRGSILDTYFSLDGKRLTTVANSGEITTWDLGAGQQPEGKTTVQIQTAFPGPVCAAHTPDNRYILSNGNGSLVYFTDATTGCTHGAFKSHKDGIQALSLSKQGKYIAAVSRTNNVRVWTYTYC